MTYSLPITRLYPSSLHPPLPNSPYLSSSPPPAQGPHCRETQRGRSPPSRWAEWEGRGWQHDVSLLQSHSLLPAHASLPTPSIPLPLSLSRRNSVLVKEDDGCKSSIPLSTFPLPLSTLPVPLSTLPVPLSTLPLPLPPFPSPSPPFPSPSPPFPSPSPPFPSPSSPFPSPSPPFPSPSPPFPSPSPPFPSPSPPFPSSSPLTRRS
ncbi:unnamed protein product [Closterium sp. Naga37s-1]|nr:unnamed protein product [Closterium sp. Naga37s-1]